MEVFTPPPYREARLKGRQPKLTHETRLLVAAKVTSKEMTFREAAKAYGISTAAVSTCVKLAAKEGTKSKRNEKVNDYNAKAEGLSPSSSNKRVEGSNRRSLFRESGSKKNSKQVPVDQKIQWIRDNYKQLGSIAKGCRMMGISRSTFYHKPTRKEQQFANDVELKEPIENIHLEFPGYGYRRVKEHLLEKENESTASE